MRLALVYNTSAYDALSSLELMDGLVDIYLPDFKYWDEQKAFAYLRARDYPEVARAAIAEMHRQVGELELDGQGMARRGLLLRHLVMPGALEDTRAILRWVASRLSPRSWVNLMEQYRPDHKAADHPELNRRPRSGEFAEALHIASREGLTRLDRRRADMFRA